MRLNESDYDRMPASATLPAFQDLSKLQPPPRLAFLRKRIRFKGSSVSVPLGVLLVLPFTVLTLVLILLRHTDSGGSGTGLFVSPPMLRYEAQLYLYYKGLIGC